MAINSFRFSALLLICSVSFYAPARAQRAGTVNRPSVPGVPRPNANTQSTPTQMFFLSGLVVLESGAPPPEPVGIERTCAGASKLEGYTDFKGKFSIQLGQSQESMDASETGNTAGNGGGIGLGFGANLPANRTADGQRRALLGCQVRAVLAGYQSTSASLVPEGNNWELQVGTIILKRMGDAPGATISLTTMAAPEGAKREYQKAWKEVTEKKFEEALKHLSKAVEQYPQFAAAWSLSGDVNRGINHPDRANEDYNRAIAADPQFVNPYFGLASMALQAKNWEETVKLTEQVARLNGAAFPLSYMYNAAANFYLQRLDMAEQSARKFATLDTDHHYPMACLLLADILAGKHNYAAAAQELNQYLRLAPNASNSEIVRARQKQYQQLSMARRP
jgi:tetratricopeptide (TPR) repeat protein